MPENKKELLCSETFEIADDHGDNHATMRCGLDKGHQPPHQEVFEREDRGGSCVFTWYDLTEEAMAEEERWKKVGEEMEQEEREDMIADQMREAQLDVRE